MVIYCYDNLCGAFFMKKAGQWKNRMVLALELPPDLAYNETIVTLTGQTEAVIENYKSVFKYTPSEIVIQSFCGKVTISGTIPVQ